jgi:leader peptidase (prepilin peptidase)/N-methyltransferase
MNDGWMGLIVTILAGLALGSFANVIIYRVPRNKSIVRPRSACTTCGNMIPWYDNIPLVSYFVLRGKCRFCKSRISIMYPFVELLTAFLFGMIFIVFGPVLESVWYMSFVFILIITAFVDLEHMIIPQSFVNAGLILAVSGLITFWDNRWISALIGALITAGVLYLAGILGKAMFNKESMGFGDVLLGLITGLFLGWKLSIMMLFLTFCSAAVILLILMAFKKVKTGVHVPFGPFMALGSVLSLFFGEYLIDLYINYVWI